MLIFGIRALFCYMHIMYSLSYVEAKTVHLMEVESRLMVSRGWGQGQGQGRRVGDNRVVNGHKPTFR